MNFSRNIRKHICSLLTAGTLLAASATAVLAGVTDTQGGTQTSTTSSSSSSATHYTYQQNAQHNYQSRVRGYAYSNLGDSATLFDQTYNSQPGSAEVSAARATAWWEVAVWGPAVLPGRTASYNVSASESSSTQHSQSTTDVETGRVSNTQYTNTTTYGEGTLLVGDSDGSFYVAEGSVNNNTNAHTHTDISRLHTTNDTYNHNNFYQVTGYKYVSPLVLNLDGSGALQASDGHYLPHTGSFYGQHRVLFDFFGNGFPVAMEWVGPSDGLLVAPKENGEIDGSCLFGTATGYENGYEHLATRDSDRNLKISGSELDGLAVWQDRNTNGRADAGEVTSVQQLGITEIGVAHQAMKGSFVRNGQTHSMFDWWPNVMNVKRIKAPTAL
ncbi:MAG: hypothetical protein HY319_07600 [Armatimonadetes bacterium]|nr:hypothetical protein [Armatimonadota bacterium]